jgi:hypothetical protein
MSGREINQAFAHYLRLDLLRLSAGRGGLAALGALLLVLASGLRALADVPVNPGGTGPELDFWSFGDTNTWHSDFGFAPLSFTNIWASPLGLGNSMVLDSTNAAWLRYNVTESNGTNNLAVKQGTVMFWFAPNWAGTNEGGNGPGRWGRLIETGAYTTNAAYGWWSLYFDDVGCGLYFSGQTNNGSGATYLAAQVSLSSNYWHHFALTYCSTGSALYLDGSLLTNGSSVTYWPGLSVLTNGFWLGSDSNGVAQAHGKISGVSTYNYVLDPGTISGDYSLNSVFYWNSLFMLAPPPSPGTNAVEGGFGVFTGTGFLQPLVTNLTGCAVSNRFWFKDVSAVQSGTNMTLTFTMAGGFDGVSTNTGAPQNVFDVFATDTLPGGALTNGQWSLMGRTYRCATCQLTVSSRRIYLVASTIEDSDRDGLTDAYEVLVSKTDPTKADTNNDGIPDAWAVLEGLNPILSGLAGQDPDYDGLTNLREYLWGTRPTVSEGFGVLVSSPSGSSGIP